MLHRRRFLVTTAEAAIGVYIVPRSVLGKPGQTPPSERLNIAGIGVGGQGGGVLGALADQHQNIVALCDVDGKYAAHTFQTYPRAETFRDYRMLLDKRRDVDAVVIATPDHMHAPTVASCRRARPNWNRVASCRTTASTSWARKVCSSPAAGPARPG